MDWKRLQRSLRRIHLEFTVTGENGPFRYGNLDPPGSGTRESERLTFLIQIDPLRELRGDRRLPGGGGQIEASSCDANGVRKTSSRSIRGSQRVEGREVAVFRESGGTFGKPHRLVTAL